MKVLVTGASGFVAKYAIADLKAAGHSVEPSSRSQDNLLDPIEAERLIDRCRPDAVLHLSGISEPNKTQATPADYLDANAVSTFNLCRALMKRNHACSFLYVSSAFVFGAGKKESNRFNEIDLPAPENAYGFSKLAGEQVASAFRSDILRVTIARPFNHIGPGQRNTFVCAAFAERVAAAKNGDTIKVGNLNGFRDFSDVRDIARAYRLILERKATSPLFVLGSGRPTQIKDVLAKLIAISKKDLKVETDPALLTKKDFPYLLADPALAKKELGWSCEIPLDDSLKAIYDSL